MPPQVGDLTKRSFTGDHGQRPSKGSELVGLSGGYRDRGSAQRTGYLGSGDPLNALNQPYDDVTLQHNQPEEHRQTGPGRCTRAPTTKPLHRGGFVVGMSFTSIRKDDGHTKQHPARARRKRCNIKRDLADHCSRGNTGRNQAWRSAASSHLWRSRASAIAACRSCA